jgi:integrase
MAPHRKPPRLWLRRSRNGRAATWIVLDNGKQISTGFGRDDREQADRALAQYIHAKWEPAPGKRSAEQVPVADALTLYLQDVVPEHARPEHTARRIEHLLGFFGRKTASEINGSLCRKYIKHRKSESSAARELNDLKAALLYFHKEGYMRDRVVPWIPPRAEPVDRWITRQEAAKLIRTMWRRPGMRHIAKFALVALYTGARSGRICGTAFGRNEGMGYIDLQRGTFHPKPGRRKTKKRQATIQLPRRLLAHLRRWHRNGQRYVVEWHGKPIERMDHCFRDAVKLAGLDDDITPHILKHTAITWMLQRDVPLWEVAGYTGTSVQTIERVYGHHAVDHMSAVLSALDRPGGPMNGQRIP